MCGEERERVRKELVKAGMRVSKGKKHDLIELLSFARIYGSWASYAADGYTRELVRWLAGRGFLQVNRFGQMRATTEAGEPWVKVVK